MLSRSLDLLVFETKQGENQFLQVLRTTEAGFSSEGGDATPMRKKSWKVVVFVSDYFPGSCIFNLQMISVDSGFEGHRPCSVGAQIVMDAEMLLWTDFGVLMLEQTA